MTPITKQSTIGELVTKRPGRSILFEKLNIDYCCGGQKTLEEACTKKGIAVEEVLQELQALDTIKAKTDEQDWSQASLSELVQHLLDVHHTYTKDALARLAYLTDKVARVHGPNKPSLIQVHREFMTLKTELDSHMEKEELVLFPYCQELDTAQRAPQFHCGTILNPINVMRREHEDAGILLATIRELTQDYAVPPDACNTYRAMLDALEEFERDLHLHIHKENNILFPKALATSQRLAEAGCNCS